MYDDPGAGSANVAEEPNAPAGIAPTSAEQGGLSRAVPRRPAKPGGRSRVTASVDRDQWIQAEKMKIHINQVSKTNKHNMDRPKDWVRRMCKCGTRIWNYIRHEVLWSVRCGLMTVQSAMSCVSHVSIVAILEKARQTLL